MKKSSYSQSRAFRGLFWASFKSLLRNPSLILFNLLFPLLLICGANYLPSPLPQSGILRWNTAIAPEPEFWQTLKNRQHLTLLNFADSLSKTDALLAWDTTQKAYILSYKTANLNVQNLLYDAIFLSDRRYLGKQSPIIQKYALYSDNSIRQQRGIQVLKIIAFVVFAGSIFGVAFTFFHLRQDNVFKLIFATPIHKLNIIFAELSSRFLFIFTSSGLILLLGWAILGTDMPVGSGFFWQVLGIIGLGVLAFMPYGFLISIFARSIPAVPILGNMFLIPQWILSGLFLNVEQFPIWLQKIASLLPFSCFHEALMGVENSQVMGANLLYLVAYGLVGLALSFRFFRWS